MSNTKTVKKNVADLAAGDRMSIRYDDVRTVAAMPEWKNGRFLIKFTDGTSEWHDGFMPVQVKAE